MVLEEEEEEEIFDEINELPQVYTSYLDVSVKVSIPFGNKKLPRQTSLIFVGLNWTSTFTITTKHESRKLLNPNSLGVPSEKSLQARSAKCFLCRTNSRPAVRQRTLTSRWLGREYPCPLCQGLRCCICKTLPQAQRTHELRAFTKITAFKSCHKLVKIQFQNFNQTSTLKSWPNFWLKMLAKLQLQNLD